MVKLGDINPQVWDQIIEDLDKRQLNFEFNENDFKVDYKFVANKRKYNREIFEQYGYFKDIILNPNVQYMLSLSDRYLDLNVTLGDPLLPLTSVAMLLIGLSKRFPSNIWLFVAAILLNVNPLYIIFAFILYKNFNSKRKPKNFKQINKNTIPEDFGNYSGVRISKDHSSKKSIVDTEYDHVLVGNGVSTYYCAALLSRVGHKCCVVSPTDGAKLDHRLIIDDKEISIPLNSYLVGRVDKYQVIFQLTTF